MQFTRWPYAKASEFAHYARNFYLLCQHNSLILMLTYYAQNYASIICKGLVNTARGRRTVNRSGASRTDNDWSHIFSRRSRHLDPSLGEERARCQHEDGVQNGVDGVLHHMVHGLRRTEVVAEAADRVGS